MLPAFYLPLSWQYLMIVFQIQYFLHTRLLHNTSRIELRTPLLFPISSATLSPSLADFMHCSNNPCVFRSSAFFIFSMALVTPFTFFFFPAPDIISKKCFITAGMKNNIITALFTHPAVFDHVLIERNMRSWSFITCEKVLEKIPHKLHIL